MKDDAYTDPAAIRAMYSSRGRNSRLNISKAESLGVNASNVSPTQGGNPARSSGSAVASPSANTQPVIDPVYTTDPIEPTYKEGTYYRDVDALDGIEQA